METPADPAFDELLTRVHWVRNLALALVRDNDRADDLSQEAWRRALERTPRDSTAWRGWFSRVMRNTIEQERRAVAQRGIHHRTLSEGEAAGTPEETVLRLETQQTLGRLIQRLPEPYRAAVLLHYFEGWSLKRIADREGLDERAIESRLRKGRQILREGLMRGGPAGRWAHGLLLLAGARRGGWTVPRLAAAAALVAIAAVTAQRFRDAVPAAGTANRAASFGAAGSPQAADAGAILASYRREDAPPGPTILFDVVDADSGRSVEGLDVRVEYLDAAGLVVGRAAWRSKEAAPFAAPAPRDAVRLLYRIEGAAAYAGVPDSYPGNWMASDRPERITLPVLPVLGEVRGFVLDDGGAPVAGAEVGVWLRNDAARGDSPTIRIRSDESGAFRLPFTRVLDGRAALLPIARGHAATRGFLIEQERSSGFLIEDVTLVLAPGRELSVEVLDEDGAPVPDAQVTVWPAFGEDELPFLPSGEYTGRLQHLRLTDAAGLAPAIAVGREPCSVHVRHPDFADWQGLSPAGESRLTIRLGPPDEVRGRILKPDGRPAAGVRIAVESPTQRLDATTDEEGIFRSRAPGLAGGEVRLLVQPPQPWAFQVVGPLRPGAPIECRLQPGLRLAARLADADGRPWDPARPVRCEVRGGAQARAPGRDERSLQPWIALLRELRGDARSPFGGETELDLAGLPAGEYLVSFRGDEGLIAEARVAAGAPPATIRAGSYPEPRAQLAGTVVHAASGAPIAQFQVALQRLGSADPEDRLPERLVLDCDAPDGRFLLRGVPPGWWSVRVHDRQNRSGWGLEAVQIEVGERRLEPALDEAFAGVLTIRHADGRRAGGARVRLLGPDGAALPEDARSFRLRAAEDGTLRLERLPRGTPIRVEVSLPEGGGWKVAHVSEPGALDPDRALWELRLPR